jgi:hypothetical protein
MVSNVSSFSPVQVPVSYKSSPSINTELNLVPKQGCQLAAAAAAAFAKQNENLVAEEEKTINNNNNHQNLNPTDATREFVSRLFHLPFGKGSSQSEQDEEVVIDFKIPGIQESSSSNNSNTNNSHDDVVLFPIVGFQYVKLQDGHIRGIPSSNASPEKAVCNLDAMNKSMNQPTYGWFTYCCTLGDLYASDDEYCGTARRLKLEAEQADSDESGSSTNKPHPSEMLP